jgi:hypothetical protein
MPYVLRNNFKVFLKARCSLTRYRSPQHMHKEVFNKKSCCVSFTLFFPLISQHIGLGINEKNPRLPLSQLLFLEL